jgi:hypothetical protein
MFFDMLALFLQLNKFTPSHALSRNTLFSRIWPVHRLYDSWCSNLTQAQSFSRCINLGHRLSLVGQVMLRQIRLCRLSKICKVSVPYDGRLGYGCSHQVNFDFSVTIISLVNVLYIWTVFLLLNTFCQACSRLVSLCREILYILLLDLYAVWMTCWCNLKQTHSLLR